MSKLKDFKLQQLILLLVLSLFMTSIRVSGEWAKDFTTMTLATSFSGVSDVYVLYVLKIILSFILVIFIIVRFARIKDDQVQGEKTKRILIIPILFIIMSFCMQSGLNAEPDRALANSAQQKVFETYCDVSEYMRVDYESCSPIVSTTHGLMFHYDYMNDFTYYVPSYNVHFLFLLIGVSLLIFYSYKYEIGFKIETEKKMYTVASIASVLYILFLQAFIYFIGDLVSLSTILMVPSVVMITLSSNYFYTNKKAD